MKKVILLLIRIYQYTISPDHSRFYRVNSIGCRFYPSCSEYMHNAITEYGILRGSAKGVKRIARCNPFNPGGVDFA